MQECGLLQLKITPLGHDVKYAGQYSCILRDKMTLNSFGKEGKLIPGGGLADI